MNAEQQCVGFADCPCRKHVILRRDAALAHPVHENHQDDFCGACQRKYRDDRTAAWVRKQRRAAKAANR